jgi:dihydroxyacetone kinase
MTHTSKHFLPTAPAAVAAALRAQPRLNPSVRLDAEHKVVYRIRRHQEQGAPQQRVGVVSGGGSGHEPSFAGFVGAGLLSASAAGSVFASPGAGQVEVAIGRAREAVGGGAVCVVIMNYTVGTARFYKRIRLIVIGRCVEFRHGGREGEGGWCAGRYGRCGRRCRRGQGEKRKGRAEG